MTKCTVRILTVGGLALVLGLAGTWRADGVEPAAEGEKIATLVRELENLGPAGLQRLEPIDIRPYQLPSAGVDVMRAQLEETYVIDGIGEDTVQLSGWIAVRHSDPRPAEGYTDLTWNTAVLDTDFVGLELHGYSEVFGPVEVRLHVNPQNPARGQVGRIEIPELARVRLLARLDKSELPGKAQANKGSQPAAKGGGESGKTAAAQEDPKTKPAPAQSRPAAGARPTFKIDGSRTIRRDVPQVQPIGTQRQQLAPADEEIIDSLACGAETDVAIILPDLGLRMTTEKPTVWYSLVDTIPPVGHTASITIEPVRLIADGRAVGTLASGVVKFREVVRHVPLTVHGDQLAGNKP
jgi:hypothetical protein